MKTLKSVNMHFTDALNFETYRLLNQSQRNDGHIAGKIGNWAKHMDIHMISTTSNRSSSISVLSLLHGFKTAFDSNAIQKGTRKGRFVA